MWANLKLVQRSGSKNGFKIFPYSDLTPAKSKQPLDSLCAVFFDITNVNSIIFVDCIFFLNKYKN